MADFRISTYNVGSSSTLAGLLSFLKVEKPHLVMLQEVILSSEQLNLLVNNFGYKAESNIDIFNLQLLEQLLSGNLIFQCLRCIM